MPFEVKLRDRISRVELLSRQDNQLLVELDGKEYELDFVKVSEGRYSVIYKNRSFNIELIPMNGVKKYLVNTLKTSYEVEIIDAETKYLASRTQGREDDGNNVISSLIPGKVVKVFVEKGDKVEAGQTVVIISAMKMESEFKAMRSGTIADVRVSDGQTVEARQPLVIIEFDKEE